MRRFDPRAVGRLECRAWETYYRRRWGACLVAFVALVRAAFRMSWPRTLAGAWLVLRANMKWAPFPRNDPDATRVLMTRYTSTRQRAAPARSPLAPGEDGVRSPGRAGALAARSPPRVNRTPGAGNARWTNSS